MPTDSVLSRAEGLIRQLVRPETEERVEGTVKRFSPIVRELIRAETGLKLSDGEQRGALPIRVTRGMPFALARVVAEEPDPVVWKLLALRSRLGETADTLAMVEELLPSVLNWPSRPAGADELAPSVPGAQRFMALLAELKRVDATKEKIKEITSEDILGCYFYPENRAPFIEIYWMPIGLIAQAINVAVENLVIVVLVHELAHGYTHIGCDIDAERWERDNFARTDVEVKEGLAQHYTAVITQKLESRAPGAHKAYERFLELQSGPYLFHKDWLKEHPARRGEAVRYTLLAARRGAINKTDWLSLLGESSQALSRPATRELFG